MSDSILTWRITATNANDGRTVEVKVRGTPTREELAHLLLEKAGFGSPYSAVRGDSAEDLLSRNGFAVTKAEVVDVAKPGSASASGRRKSRAA